MVKESGPRRGWFSPRGLRYGRPEMLKRETDRRGEPGRTQGSASLRHRSSNSVLALQRSIGNRAVGQVLARAPVATGTVEIPGVGKVKVKGGNLEEWSGTGTLDTVEVTSEKGKHSKKLEKASTERTRSDVKVTIAAAHNPGDVLNVGGGTVLEIKDARVKGYTLADGVETWRIADFERVSRTKTTRKVS